MSKLKTFIKLLKNDRKAIFGNIVNNLTRKGLLNWMQDEMFLRLRYRSLFHKKLNLCAPKTFNEKLQWLKLYDRKLAYVELVDKYAVRRVIADAIGQEYLVPLYGVWAQAEDIDFDMLPDQFVLKCNHDSGSVIVCTDKKSFDREAARRKLNRHLSQNLFWWGREWPYKNVKPCIIAEKYMSDSSGGLPDYKIHMFNGQPKFVLVCKDRFQSGGLTEDFYSLDWQRLPMKRPNIPNSAIPVEKPICLDKMLELSTVLAKHIPFARIDFYEINGKLYFGEITFFPASGMAAFEPEEWDYTLGSWITLPEKTEG